MKANEAPEKIYVADATFPDYVDFDGSPINTKRIDDHDIEYTRTDAFIEKAVKFLKDRVDIPYDIKTNEKGEPYADSYSEYALARLEAANKIIDEFKNYMKGE